MLTIVYRGRRGIYRYFDVPSEEYAAFRAAPSKGTYLNEIFKTRQYRYERERQTLQPASRVTEAVDETKMKPERLTSSEKKVWQRQSQN